MNENNNNNNNELEKLHQKLYMLRFWWHFDIKDLNIANILINENLIKIFWFIMFHRKLYMVTYYFWYSRCVH